MTARLPPAARINDGGLVLFATGANFPPFEYVVHRPDAPEHLTGFTLLVISELCETAGLSCKVVRDAYENCWTADENGGVGVMRRWYAA